MYKCDNCKSYFEEYDNETTDSPSTFCPDCTTVCLGCEKVVGVSETTRGYCPDCAYFCEVCSLHIGFVQTLSNDGKCYGCYVTAKVKSTRLLTTIPDIDLRDTCFCRACTESSLFNVKRYCKIQKKLVKGGDV